MRTRMSGGVGAGRSILPATRFSGHERWSFDYCALDVLYPRFLFNLSTTLTAPFHSTENQRRTPQGFFFFATAFRVRRSNTG